MTERNTKQRSPRDRWRNPITINFQHNNELFSVQVSHVGQKIILPDMTVYEVRSVWGKGKVKRTELEWQRVGTAVAARRANQ